MRNGQLLRNPFSASEFSPYPMVETSLF